MANDKIGKRLMIFMMSLAMVCNSKAIQPCKFEQRQTIDLLDKTYLKYHRYHIVWHRCVIANIISEPHFQCKRGHDFEESGFCT